MFLLIFYFFLNCYAFNCINKTAVDLSLPYCKNVTLSSINCFKYAGLVYCNPPRKVSQCHDNVCSENSTFIYRKFYLTWVLENELDVVVIGTSTEYDNLNQVDHLKRSILQSAYATFNQPILHVVESYVGIVFVAVTSTYYSNTYNCSDVCDITLEDNYFVRDGVISVTITYSGSPVFTEEFPIAPLISCPFPQTPFSPVWKYTWGCLDTLGRFVLVASIFGIITMVVLFLVLIALILFYCYMKAQSSVTINNFVDNVKSGVQDIELPTLRRDRGMKLFTFMFLISICSAQPVTCMVSPPPSPVCQYTSSISSEALVCNNGFCEVVFNELVIIPNAGYTVCLDMHDAITNDFMFRMSFKYQFSHDFLTLEDIYFTSDWIARAQSSKACYGTAGECVAGCPAYNSLTWNNTRALLFSEFPESSFINCDHSCGCAGCGCFFCSDGCMWTAVNKLPISFSGPRIFRTKQPRIMSRSPNIAYQILLNNSCVIQQGLVQFSAGAGTTNQIFVTPVDVDHQFPIKITLVASNQLANVLFSNDCFFLKANPGMGGIWAHVGPCAPKNGPIARIPGDIQAGASDMEGYFFDKSDINIGCGSDTCNFQFPPVGSHLIDTYPKTNNSSPMTIGGQQWHYFDLGGGDGYVYSPNYNPGSISFMVTTVGELNISYQTVTVCPSLVYINSTGCSSCAAGASVYISAKSTCYEGAAKVTLSLNGQSLPVAMLGTGTIFLDTEFKTFQILIYPIVEMSSFTLTLTDDIHSDSITFENFFPKSIILIDENGTVITTNSSAGTASLDFTDWWNSLTGNWSWGKWIILSIGSIVLLGVLSAVIIGIVKVSINLTSLCNPAAYSVL